MVTVTRTTRATSRNLIQHFEDEAGAYDFIFYSLYDHSRVPKRTAAALTRCIMGLAHHLHQMETGSFFWTVHRH